MSAASGSHETFVSIQYARALAAVVVVAWHTGFSYTVLGQAGVDLFFVISGFVMMLVSSNETHGGRFMLARILRIVPLYWSVTLLVAGLDGATGGALLSSLLFWPDRTFPIVIQGWSLDLEMSYYVLFALSLGAPKRWRLLVLSVEMVALCFVLPVVGSGSVALSAFANPLAFEFLAGVGMFVLWRRGWILTGGLAWCLGGAGVIALAATHGIGGAPAGWSRVALWGIPCWVIVMAGLGIERAKQLPRVPSLKWVGDASYAIYLTHLLALRLVQTTLQPMWAPLALAIAVAWACLVGLAVYYVVDRPLHSHWSRTLRRLWPRKAERQLSASSAIT